LTVFEEQLESDPELKSELDFYHLADSIIIKNKLIDVHQTIREVENVYVKRQKLKSLRNILITVLIVAAGIAFYAFFNQSEKGADNLQEEIPVDTEKTSVQFEKVTESIAQKETSAINTEWKETEKISISEVVVL